MGSEGSQDSASIFCSTMSKLDKAVSKDIENYDKSKLGKVEAKDGATPAQSRDMVMAGIEYHKGRGSMKKVETVEKNSLPTKEDIQKEKRESPNEEEILSGFRMTD